MVEQLRVVGGTHWTNKHLFLCFPQKLPKPRETQERLIKKNICFMFSARGNIDQPKKFMNNFAKYLKILFSPF